MAVVRNRVIRRRLQFSLLALLVLAVLHGVAGYAPAVASHQAALERLLLALALINAAVTLLFNPWSEDRVFDRSPAIVQDTVVVALFAAAAVFLLRDSTFLTASAIAAAAVGFALQETLANAFAGLAIQVEKPFRVGHWVTVAGHEGEVVEVTWRATKIRTKAGNLVVIPNNTIAREAINNYSEPALPTRIIVPVGAGYGVPPNEVREAILAALRRARRVLPSPPPEALVHDFGDSAVIYHAWFWIADFSQLEYVQDETRRAIYYEFRRRKIEIPWPIQIEYQREEPKEDDDARRESFRQTIAGTSVLAGLDADAHQALAASAEERMYGDGETIVSEGEPGTSMFVVRRGRVSIRVGPDEHEVAVTDAGGYFGEMSLLTGDPRSATVKARGDCAVLEIAGEAFGAYIRSHPDVVEQLASAAAERRRELETSRGAGTPPLVETVSLAQRIRRFFGLAGVAHR